jgi:5-methylcytosine-specific restriction endonuclease McrA
LGKKKRAQEDYSKNRERYLEQQRGYRAVNPEKVGAARKVARQRRRALMRDAVCDGHTSNDLSVYWLEQGFVACVLQGPDCDVVYEHMDHLTPLSRGGSHSRENLVPACARCNWAKYNRTYGEWVRFVNEQRRAKVN